MEEIFALQKQLAAVQESQSINKLSDRIIVDIVEHIIQDYNIKLLFTMDGQEYMTKEYLEQQIYEMACLKGRVSIIDLPQLINISLEKIEACIDIVTNKNNKEITRLQDQLMSQYYLDSICEEINEELQQKQQILFFEITQKYSLPMAFVRSLIEKQVGLLIQGVISVGGDKLTTISYIDSQKSKLKGSLRAAIKPISLNTIMKDYQIDEQNIYWMIDDLIKEEAIDGKQQAGMFIPTKFIKNQEMIVRNFFQQNGIIEYEMMQKQLFIQKPKDYLKSMFKDNCIFLENSCYNLEKLQGITDQLDSFLQEDGFTDLNFMLPSNLNQDDIEALVFKHMQLQDVELDESFIFSTSFLDRATSCFRDKIVDSIFKSPQKLIESQDSMQSQSQIQGNSSGIGGAAGGKKKKGGQPPQPGASAGSQNSKIKKNKSQQSDENGSGVGVQGGQQLFNNEEIVQTLIANKVIAEDDDEEYFVSKLTNILNPRLTKLYQQIKVEYFENKKSASSEILSEIQGKIKDLYQSLLFCGKVFREIEGNYSTIDLKLFYDSSLYAERLLLENIVVYFCKKYCIQMPQTLFQKKEDKQIEGKPYPSHVDCGLIRAEKIFKSKQTLLQAIDIMPKEYQKFLKECLEQYLKKNFHQFLELIQANSEIIGIKTQLDKKTEKNFIYYIIHTTKEAIKKDKGDVKMTFERILILHLIERHNLFFIGNPEDTKYTIQQCNVLIEVGKNDEITPKVQKACTLLQEIQNMNQGDANYTAQFQEFEATVEYMTKLVKL